MKVLIIGDGGHGIDTLGKRTPQMPNDTIIKESQFNKPTCKRFLELCNNQGFEILNVAPEEQDTPLKTRTDRANKAYKDFKAKYKDGIVLYISFHFNAYNGIFDDKKGGIEVYHYPSAMDSKLLAESVYNQLIKGTKQNGRGVKSSNFHVLRETIMTAILIEAGFMDKLEEANLMLDEKFQNEVAKETLQGVLQYLDVVYDYKPTTKTNLEKKTLKIRLHNGKIINQEGIFEPIGINYIPIRFLENLGYEVSLNDDIIEINYRKG